MLVVQNSVDVTDVGAASGVVSFFRSLGGTIDVAALGAVLAARVADRIAVAMVQAGMPVTELRTTVRMVEERPADREDVLV